MSGNEACAEARSEVRDRLKKRWAGKEVEIDPAKLGEEIDQQMRRSLVGNLPHKDQTEDEHQDVVADFRESQAKVKRTLDMLRVSFDEAVEFLRGYYKDRYGHLTPGYYSRRKALKKLYGVE